MGQTKYNLKVLSEKENDIIEVNKRIDYIFDRFKIIKNSVDTDIIRRDNISNQFNTLTSDFQNLIENTYNTSQIINKAITEYNDGEQQIQNLLNGLLDINNNSCSTDMTEKKHSEASISGVSILQNWFEKLYNQLISKVIHIKKFFEDSGVCINNKDYLKTVIKDKDTPKSDRIGNSSIGTYSKLGSERIFRKASEKEEYFYDEERIKEGSKVLRNIFNNYSIDAGIVDIDGESGQIIINHYFIPNIGLNYTEELTRLDNGMIGTKYHLDVCTGRISYNGQDTSNLISEESQWEIKYKYDLGEVKQLRIDAQNKVNDILIQQGVDLTHEHIKLLNQRINFMENPITIGVSKGYDFCSTIGLGVYESLRDYSQLIKANKLYVLGVAGMGALDGGIKYFTEPSAIEFLNDFTYNLHKKKLSYWNEYNSKIENIIKTYSNKETNSLKEEYYYKAIIDYANIRLKDKWRIN